LILRESNEYDQRIFWNKYHISWFIFISIINRLDHSNPSKYHSRNDLCKIFTFNTLIVRESVVSVLTFRTNISLIYFSTFSHWIQIWRNHPKTCWYVLTFNEVWRLVIRSPISIFWSNIITTIASSFLRALITLTWWIHLF
jgi:hypothetical protein